MDEKFIRKRIDEQWAYMRELRCRKCNRHWKNFVMRSAVEVITRLYLHLIKIPGRSFADMLSISLHIRSNTMLLYSAIPLLPFIGSVSIVGEAGLEIGDPVIKNQDTIRYLKSSRKI